MKFEKFINSGFFKFMEKLYFLIILNIFTALSIILGLGFFSLFPAITSLVICIKSSQDGETFSVVKAYFKTIIKYWKKTFLLSLFYFVIMIIMLLWTYYFYCWVQESNNILFGIGYYLSLFLCCLIILAAINACFIFAYFPYLSYKKMVKYSFVLLKIIALKALIMFTLLLLFIYIGVLVVYSVPLILISLYIFIFNLLVCNDYNKLIIDGETSISVNNNILKI